MAEFPALPLFTDAYIADTAHLTNEEHGVYLRLLMFAWRTSSCSLPDNDARLALMVGVTKGKWNKLKPTIMKFWKLENNEWTQKKLSTQRAFVSKQREQKRIAGEASAKARALKSLDTGLTAVAPPLPTATQQPIPIPKTTSIKRDTKEVSPKKPPIKTLMVNMLCEISSKQVAQDFVEHRWAIKKPMTEQAAKMLVNKLRGNMNADAVLSLSIENGWPGVYPESNQLKGNQNGNGTNHKQTSGDTQFNEARERAIRIGGLPEAQDGSLF